MIRIGPSGWTHPGLDRAWPLKRGAQFEPLSFLGQFFGAVEVDVTAHVLPREEHIVRWAAKHNQHKVMQMQSLTQSTNFKLILKI